MVLHGVGGVVVCALVVCRPCLCKTSEQVCFGQRVCTCVCLSARASECPCVCVPTRPRRTSGCLWLYVHPATCNPQRVSGSLGTCPVCAWLACRLCSAVCVGERLRRVFLCLFLPVAGPIFLRPCVRAHVLHVLLSHVHRLPLCALVSTFLPWTHIPLGPHLSLGQKAQPSAVPPGSGGLCLPTALCLATSASTLSLSDPLVPLWPRLLPSSSACSPKEPGWPFLDLVCGPQPELSTGPQPHCRKVSPGLSSAAWLPPDPAAGLPA